MKLTLIKNVYSRDITQKNELEVDWDGLKRLLKTPRISAHKNKTSYLFPFDFRYRHDGCYACNINAINYTALIFDVDSGCTIEEFIAEHKDYKFVLYTTFSHKESHHKFRAVFPIKEPIKYSSFEKPYFRQWFTEKYPYQDPAIMKFVGVYMPNTNDLKTYRSHVNEGKTYSFSEYLKELKPYKLKWEQAQRFEKAVEEYQEKQRAKWEYESSSVINNPKVRAYLDSPVSPTGMGNLSFTAMAVANTANDAEARSQIIEKMRADSFSEKEIERAVERAGRGR